MIYKITEDFKLIPITEPTPEEKRMITAYEQVKDKHPKLFEMIKEMAKEDKHNEDETPDKEIIEGIKQGMKEALRGEGRPAREFLNELFAMIKKLIDEKSKDNH